MKILAEQLDKHHDELCPTCQKRYNKNILRIFDCKNEKCQEILDNHAPAIIDHLNDEDRIHFEEVRNYLDITKTPYIIDKKMVRGLDYYTKTTFEITSSLLGSQDAICGGGRYDHLVEDLGSKATPAVGVACGMERLLLVLDELDNLQKEEDDTIFFVTLGNEAVAKGFDLVTNLKHQGIPAQMDFMRRSIKAQMRYAGKMNAKFVVIIGDHEIENQKVILKNMTNSEQQEVAMEQLVNILKESM